uniref:Golgi apparatus membrane protein TVP23 n=1 Tax=Salix viminalis TaxID=40686 RepID=A0A6N2KZV6_SALVM
MLGSPGQQNPNQPRVPNFVDPYQHYLGLHHMHIPGYTVGLRWWNEINDLGESVWKFQSLDQEAVPWIVLGIFSLIRLQADYCLIIGVCLTLSTANIVGFTKCRKGEQTTFSLVF